MNPIRTGRIDGAHLVAELCEVGSQDRRGYDERMQHQILRNAPFA
jgi:hypothetical protein